MTKHTPGPWDAGDRVRNFIDITHRIKTPGAITNTLCRVQARDTWAAEAEANARLIAAAPELLAALELAVEMQESVEDALPPGYGSPKNTIAWLDHARAAIARAKEKIP